jgi:hypothetical protein
MKNKIVVEFIPAKNWWSQAKWKLHESFVSSNDEVVVPIGFISDGASIPIMFRRWFSPTGKYFGAAIIHDFVLASTRDWREANRQFANELSALGIGVIRKTALISTVKLYYFTLKLFNKA